MKQLRTASDWNGSLSPRLLTKILVGLLTGTLLASASILALPSQSFSVGDLNLAAADTIRGSGGGRLASNPALSGDGSTIIFGEPGHWGWAGTPRATVQVREWNGSSWVSKGSLPDAPNREIGYWHDISDNGDVVSYSTNVLDKVFVADWSGSAWLQRPTITASQAGVSLVRHSLSGDGNVLVLGERGFDNGSEVNNGKVRTLDWDGSSWSERTAIIGAEGELLGNSRMDITADGLTISFGGSQYSNADGAEVGRVRVATWDGASWAERPALTGSQASARAANPVLSDDGTVLVFSEAEWRVSGRIRTFDWRDSAWVERPRAADGAIAWIDTDMSANGTAISMSDNDTQKVRVYDWVGDSWVQRGSDVPGFSTGSGGHYGNVASMSSNGLMVATSQVYSDVNGSRSGRVDIYRSTSTSKGVIFNSNGGSGAMATQVAASSASLSSNSFTRAGYRFSGWNTAADGSGDSYLDEVTYNFSQSISLFAQWEWAPSFYPSGPQTNVASSAVTGGGWVLCWSGPYNGFAKFSDILAACDGEYVMYTGWNGVSTSPETIPATLPILAAAPRSDVFTTTATSGIADATDSNGSKWYFGDDRGAGPDGSQAVGFTDNQSGSPCYSGSLSICWHSAPNLPGSYGWADGSASPSWAATEAGLSPGWSLGTTTFLGQSPAMGNGANYTRAIFHASNPRKTVTFDANEGSGSMSSLSGESSASLTPNSFTRTGFAFSGWNTMSDGSGTAYADSADYGFSANATLYAQWIEFCDPVETSDGSATVLSFTEVGTCLWTSPPGVTVVTHLIVGGGGGGGFRAGGGGHAGEVSAGRAVVAAGTDYEVEVGAGGTGAAGVNWRRVSGSPTYSGASGGLSSALGVSSAGGVAGSNRSALGGTGAGGANSGETGGPPMLTLIRGSGEWLAGGGGGASHYSPGAGGVGADGILAGGNAGERDGSPPSSSGFTFGSGGGGGNYGGNGGQTNYTAGSGKQGIVILRYSRARAAAAPSVSAGSSSLASEPFGVAGAPAAQGRVALEAPRRGGLLVRRAPAVIDREVLSDSTAATSEAVALVGGEEVAVSAQTRGSQFAQFATGNVSLDITVAENHGVVDAVNGAPALKVARNSPASLKGAGLLPNSKLQVFLPASDGSFIEMPALEVNAEGAFEGSLTFGTSPRSKPMPIGQRFIQIVGLDEDGIETVLDIPVTIAQPLPAPEANRVSGERPVLELGQTLALNAGAPETVNVKRSSSATSVEGDGWVFTVETDAPDTTLDAMSFTRDAPVAFSGEGFMPGTRADVWLFSDPTLLGTVDIKEDGTFMALFAVDSAFVPTGNHTLQIQGVGDDGFVRAANLGVQVVDPLDSPVVPVGGQRFDLIPLALMGTAVIGLAVLTATVIAVGRRRKPVIGLRPAL